MPMLRIKNATIVLKDALLKKSALLVSGSKIISIGRNAGRKSDCQIIDAHGCYISPGFIDTHIHGNPAKIFSGEARTGTTSIVVAISCDRIDRICNTIREIKGFKAKDLLGPNVLGVRLEGPYINRKKAGAQNPRHIKRPDRKEALRLIKKCGSILRIMTVAPELIGVNGLIGLLRRKKITASIGHSDANFEEALHGVESGINHATHIFNAMRGMDGRDPGAAGIALLDDRITAEIILDLVHVRGELFKLLLKTKGIDKVILVTDSIRHEFPNKAKYGRGVYRLKNGKLAGSSLTMIKAVKNAVRIGKVSLVDAINMATLNPAKLLGVRNKKGIIAAGMDADMVIFDREFDVKATILSGKIVYRKGGF